MLSLPCLIYFTISEIWRFVVLPINGRFICWISQYGHSNIYNNKIGLKFISIAFYGIKNIVAF
jgi:hypothetical protein